jgi:hypothetical protein
VDNVSVAVSEATRSGDPFASAGRKAEGENLSPLEARVERGLDLYAMRGHEIQDLGGGVFAVPASRGNTLYRVEYGERDEHCGCEDHKFNPHLSCKHLICVGIYSAKMRRRRKNFIASLGALGEEEE